jgi:group I intron endonuclease
MESKFSGHIYCIVCLATDKWYFGQTVKTVDKRFAVHLHNARKGLDYKLYRAIRKYGEENFTVEEVVAVSAPTKKELKAKLDFLERHFIQRYDTRKNGYNMTDGGDGQLGFVYSEISKRKMSEAACRRCLDENWKDKQARTMKRQWADVKFQKLRSIVAKKVMSDPDFQKKLGRSRRGISFTTEHKERISKAVSGERNGMFGKKHTPDVLKAISKQVMQLSLNGELIKVWISFAEIKRKLRLGKKCLKKHILNNEPYKGYLWKLANEK